MSGPAFQCVTLRGIMSSQCFSCKGFQNLPNKSWCDSLLLCSLSTAFLQCNTSHFVIWGVQVWVAKKVSVKKHAWFVKSYSKLTHCKHIWWGCWHPLSWSMLEFKLTGIPKSHPGIFESGRAWVMVLVWGELLRLVIKWHHNVCVIYEKKWQCKVMDSTSKSGWKTPHKFIPIEHHYIDLGVQTNFITSHNNNLDDLESFQEFDKNSEREKKNNG